MTHRTCRSSSQGEGNTNRGPVPHYRKDTPGPAKCQASHLSQFPGPSPPRRAVVPTRPHPIRSSPPPIAVTPRRHAHPGRRRRRHRFPPQPQSLPDATRNGFFHRVLLQPPWRRRPRRALLTRLLLIPAGLPRARPSRSPSRARGTTTTTWSIAGTRRGAARGSRSGAGAEGRWTERRPSSWSPARPGTSSRTCRTCRITSPISR